MTLLEVCEYNDLFIIIVVVQGGDVSLDYFILRAVSILLHFLFTAVLDG